MLWSDRRRVLVLLAALALASCGFAPAFAPGAPATGLIGRIATTEPNDRDGFDLVARIEERLGRSDAPGYDLDYDISTRQVDLAITRSNAINRYNIVGSVRFRLSDAKTGTVVSSGNLQSFTSFSASGTTVATDAARVDARRRLMVLLADQIVTRIVADVSARGDGG